MTAEPAGAGDGSRRLLLLRHARAVPGTDAGGDHARDLSERGRRDAASLGGALRRMGFRPDLALVSSALRTRRTWELLGAFADPAPAPVFSDRLYLATPEALRDALRDIAEPPGSVMLVGHNPGLHELALQLAEAGSQPVPAELRAALPTCTAVLFEVGADWRRLRPSGAAPRLLRP